MEEKDFEKKSTKKVGIIIAVIAVLLVAAIVGGVIYLNSTKKPAKIFSKAIENIFAKLETEEHNSGKVELELSAEIDADDAEVRAVNEILKAVKLKLTTEVDLNKKILNENIVAVYDGEEVINADALIQDESMYFYLNDIYSKYIKINEDYLEGLDLSTLFETETVDEKLIDDIKQILLDEIESKEFAQEKVELNDEKVTKTTLKLSQKELLEVFVKLLEKVNEYEKIEDLEYLIEDIEDEIEYLREDEESSEEIYFEISIYTKGLKNEFVKVEFIAVNLDYEEAMALEINKKDENKWEVNFLMNEDSTNINKATKVCMVEIVKENENNCEIKLLINEDSSKSGKLLEILTVKIVKENENKGTVKFQMNVEDEATVIINLGYNIDYKAKIEERNTSNSIEIDSMTEADLNEMMLNVQNNEILYSLIELVMNNGFTSYEDDYYYDDSYEDDYYYDEQYSYDDFESYEEDNYMTEDYIQPLDSIPTY